MERLAKFLQEHKPKRILDVGTGAGNFILLLKQLYPSYDQIVGIDTSSYAVTSAAKSFHEDEKITIMEMDALNMSFADESFDVVCLSNSLHHLSHMEQIMNEMARVVKPGGHVIISEMIANDLDARQHAHLLMHHFAAKIDRYLGDTHNDTFTEEEILDLLQKHSPLLIMDHWPLQFERRTSNTEEEVTWLKGTLDRVVSRVQEPLKKQEFEQEAATIKNYIEKHGFDSATTVLVVMQK